ncbi:MAG TPA: polysaccharide biosynthesis tyrosine autokinase [Candidatus Paceibacterota bacterium]|nr:polysaccharide biosynthesis tyrosine autokinase [Verrucomicrobiota bacterium]HRY48089.1 polysaccharide biosynthesis tyrosine autokinase [Candidatus Paceibacterota bacterium]
MMETGFHEESDNSMAEENINLRHYWHIILERRWLVITAFISIFALCLIYLYRAPRIYQAVTRLQIDRETDNVLNLREGFTLESREQDYLQTQYKNLQSRSLIASVVARLKLDKDERYSAKRDIVKAVLDDITVSPIRLSRLVEVKVEHTDPQQAANIASNLVEIFVDNNLNQKSLASSKAGEWLEQESDAQKKIMMQAEEAVYKAQSENISLDDTQNIALQALKLAQEELVRAQSRATIAQQTDLEVKRMLASGTPVDSIPQVASDKLIQELKARLVILQAELANLLKRYKDKYPLVIQKREEIESLGKSIQAESAKIIEAIGNEARLCRSQEDSLKKIVEERSKEVIKLGESRAKYNQLSQDVLLNRKLYEIILQNQKDNKLMASSKINNMRVVDPAYAPPRFIKPRIVLTLILGVIGGLIVGCGMAFFVDYLDDSIKTQDDVELHLRLPFLGYVPNIKTNSVIERDLQSHLHPQSTAAEGFRTIRAAVALMPKANTFQLIAVTSTIPSEGKSLLASNLSIVTAQTGLKTLLVDADLRRPSVHKAFQLHSPVGLSAYLQNETEHLDDIIHKTEVPNMDVVCCGAIPNSPSELAGSKRMKQFLEEARRRYDRVFIDCPPVSAVSDPLIIAAMTDGVLFVTKFNKIRREHARKSVQRIQDAGIHILGAVLNNIDFEGKDSYYYSYYYYQNRYYASHYRSDGSKQPVLKEPASKG